MFERYLIVADWPYGRDVYLGEIFESLDSALEFISSDEWEQLGATNPTIKIIPTEVYL